MSKEIRLLVVGGAGEMGRQCIKAATERGAKVVASTGRKNQLGEDVGLLAGLPDALGITLEPSDRLEALIKETRPDVAIMCSLDFRGQADDMRQLLKNNVNVLTLAEEAYYPKIDDQALYEELDLLAKEHSVTLVGNGMQDVNCSNIAVVMSGNCRKLTEIYGENCCILDHCGPQEFEGLGIGCTDADDFASYHADHPSPRNPYTYALYEIAEELGLTVIDELNENVEPILAKEEYMGLGERYLKDMVVGSILYTTLKTKEGIDLVAKFIYAFEEQGYDGRNIWRFSGDPSFEVVTDDPRPDISTTAGAVNRIPDVINARPGFLLVKDLTKPFFKVHSLPEYVE